MGPASGPTRLWWMETPFPGNFGDILSPYVVEKLSGFPPKFVGRGDGLLAIGSIIKFARVGTPVWGSGTPRMTDALAPDADYRAVRGPLTRDLVLQSGAGFRDLWRRRPAVAADLRSASAEEAQARTDSAIHPCAAPFASRACVRSTFTASATPDRSLHPRGAGMRGHTVHIAARLIVAQAYGIPTRWCTLSSVEKGLPGDGTKFLDHYATLGIPVEAPLDLAALDAVDQSLFDACTERADEAVRRAGAAARGAIPCPGRLPEAAARWNRTAWRPGDSAAPSLVAAGEKHAADG